MDVRSLIIEWEIIRSTVPSQSFSEEMPSGHRSVAEIAYMSRRRERWEVFVCLMGFHEKQGADPNQVLNELESYVFQRKPSEIVSSFLQYSSEFVMVSHEEFLSEAVRLRGDFGNQLIMSLSSSLDTLQECRAIHQPDWAKVWQCVWEAGGGKSAHVKFRTAGA